MYTVCLLIHPYEVVLVDFKQTLLFLKTPLNLFDHAVS